jgi:hypothetical protein
MAALTRMVSEMSQSDAEPARVFEDRMYPREWRVEWIDDDGGIEVAIFSGPRARGRAIRYADRQYGHFEEIRFGTASP